MTFSIIYTKEKCAEVYTSVNVSRKEKDCIFCVYLFWIMVSDVQAWLGPKATAMAWL